MAEVTAWAVAVAMARRGRVPQAMGRILPLGFSSGMTRAEATAPRVAVDVWLFARSVRA